MRVLFTNHTAQVSGGERSMLDLFARLPASVEPHLACPEGALAERARGSGVPVTTVTGTAASLRLHPVHTVRGTIELGTAAVELARLGRRLRPDLVHANSLRAGIVASASPARGTRRDLVLVRDRLPQTAMSRLVLELVSRRASAMVANSRFSAAQVPDRGTRVEVVPSPVDTDRYRPQPERGQATRAALDIPPDVQVLVLVAQITPWKAQDDAIRVLELLRASYPAARLLLVGSTKFVDAATRYDNRAFESFLHELAEELGVADRVLFLGEREDVPALLNAADVALLPSWEEPFGRSLVEAMASEVPVVATNAGGPSEVITDGHEGFLRPPRNPPAWADAVTRLLADADLRRTMGQRGRQRAVERFGAERHAAAMVAIYESLLS